MLNISRVVTAALIAGLLFGGAPAQAQNFPARQITIIVPNSPGTSVDRTPRLLAPEMSKTLGVPVVVENKPGGGQVIGYDYVARQAAADGHTIIVVSDSTTALMPLTFKDLKYDVNKDFVWFLGIARVPTLVASGVKQPWKTFPEMVAYAKANPGKLNFSQASPINNLYWAYLLDRFGFQVERINYASSGESLTALLRGDLHADWLTEAEAVGMKDDVRPLAMTTPVRSPRFPDVPTFLELGATEMPYSTHMFGVRAGTPQAAIDKLYAAASRALNLPEVKAEFEKGFLTVIAPEQQTQAAQSQRVVDLGKTFSVLAKKIGLEPQ
jgi:tripartite-type tricarboxylate transporter receptor subunit TctC